MNSGRVAVLAWALCAAIAAASAVFLALGPGPAPDDVFGGVGGASFLVLSLTLTTVGGLVAARAPENRVGWVFCATGLLCGVMVLAWVYADYGVGGSSGRVPGSTLAALLPTEAIAAALAFVLLLFPDGHLPSRRWRGAAWVPALAAVLLLVTDVLRPGRLDEPFATISNPLGVPGTRSAMNAVNNVGWALVLVSLALGAAALLARLRRARDLERRQLELVVAVGAIVAIGVGVDMFTWFIWPHGGIQLRMAVIGVSFATFPAAAGVAILRYRLYDIDLVVNRTLVYITLTVLLAAAYVATALLLGTALGRGSAWTTAGATLAAALCFRPLRARVQDAVDRRFNRARYDALLRIGEFMDSLRAGRAAPEAIERLLGELVGDPRLELRLFLPDGGLYVDTRGMPAADLPGDDRQQTPIERAGTPVGMVLHQPSRSDDPELLRRLVEAGGLAIEIARLRAELRRRLAEVEALAPGSSRRATRSDAGSSAISTTARNSAWCRSGWRCAMPSTSSPARNRFELRIRWTARSTSSRWRSRSCGSWRAACHPPSWRRDWRPRSESWRGERRSRSRSGRRPRSCRPSSRPPRTSSRARVLPTRSNTPRHRRSCSARPRATERLSSRSPMTASAALAAATERG